MTEPWFDVFLSYNQNDQSWVVQLRSALVERGLKMWLAGHDINAGEQFPTRAV